MPDPKPEPRVKDPDLLRELHVEWRECALCGSSWIGLSLHHILKHPRDDVRGNLIMLCGSGTTGCHGAVEAHEEIVVAALRRFLTESRPDVMDHLAWRLGSRERASERVQALR